MTSFIKNTGIIICCIYYYVKLLYIPTNKKLFFSSSAFTLLASFCFTCISPDHSYITLPLLILFIAVFTHFQTKTQLSLSITASTISFAFSYIIFFISTLLIGGITFLFYSDDLHIFFNYYALYFNYF